ncbi:MAG: ATP-binding protein [Bacteroidetes bacterium]|nr:ATP-binding protein [Bacteroidota bacterium]
MAQRKLRADFQQFTEDLEIQVINGMLAQREQALRELLSIASHFHAQFAGHHINNEDEERLKWIEEQASELSVFVTSQKMSAYFADLRHRLQVLSQSFDSTVEYVQQERCFVLSTSDSLYHREVKRLKRISRQLQRSWHHGFHRIAKVWGREPVPPPEWKHYVDWSLITRIAGIKVGAMLLDAIEEDLSLRNDLASCLVAISDAGLNEINKTEHLQAAADRLYEYISRINARLNSIKSDSEERLTAELDVLYVKLVYAGTANAAKELSDVEKLDKETDELKITYSTQLRAWDTDINTVLSQLEIDLGFQRFLSLIENEIDNVVNRLSNPFNEDVQPTLQQLFEKLEQTADEFEQIKNNKKESRTAFLKRVQTVTTELNEYLHNEFMSVLNQAVDSTDINTALEEAFAEIVLNNGLLTAETQVFSSPDEKDNTKGEPRTDTEKVDFRREITIYLNHELFRKLRLIPEKLTPMLGGIQKLGSDITQIVDVNMQIADELAVTTKQTDVAISELYDLIHDGLDRAAARSRDLTQQVANFTGQISQECTQPIQVFRQLCERIMREDDYLYIKTRNREVKVTSRAIDWKQRLVRNWNRLSDNAEAWGRLGLQIGRKQLNALQILLGFDAGEASGTIIKSEASQFLASTDKSLKQLPLIYRRLFTSEPLQETRFYKARQHTQQIFVDSFSAWQSGTVTNIALVGEKGSGKTSVINILQKELESSKVKFVRGSIDFTTFEVAGLLKQLCAILGMSPVEDPGVFIDKVNAIRTRRVIFIEGFQNVYLRHMHGFEALEAFLLIISRTGNQLFWVVSSSRYAWQYLDKIYDLDGYFTHKRMVDEVKSNSLKDIILSRHTVSGYELHFEPSPDMRDSRTFRKTSGDELEQQKLLREDYFEKLYEVTKGNISIALQYWQLSVKEIIDDVIRIRPLEQLTLTLGDGFSNDDLFALGAIIFHDDLTEQQMADALHIDYATSRMILAKLTARSILYRKEDRFYLNNLLYRQVVDLLKSKNILH